MKNSLTLVLALLIALPLFSFAAEDDDDGYWNPTLNASLSFRFGGFIPNGESDIWEENVDTFTMEVEDFNGLKGGIEFNWFAHKYFTIGLAVDVYNSEHDTEYRDFIGDDGLPIQQNISLTVVPVTATFKFTPLGNGSPDWEGERGSAFCPWIGAGIGAYSIEYEESGEFIDFSDDSIFITNFYADNETAFGAHVAAGLVVPFDLHWDVFGEARYSWVDVDLGPDFIGFEPMDIGGFSYLFGFSYRY